LTKEKLAKNGDTDRKHSTFQEDTSVPIGFRARLADYLRSGFDRGHMAPAADAKFSQAAMDETFILTNISPQVGQGFNRDCK
jgi:endonuclease G